MLLNFRVGENISGVVELVDCSGVYDYQSGGRPVPPYRILKIREDEFAIGAIIWDDIVTASGMRLGDLIEITGEMCEYKGKPQVKIRSARVVMPARNGPSQPSGEPPNFEALLDEIHTILEKSVSIQDYMVMAECELNECRKYITEAEPDRYESISGYLSDTAMLLRLTDITANEYGGGICRSLLAAGALFSGLSPIYQTKANNLFSTYQDSSERIGDFGLSNGISEKIWQPLKHMVLKCRSKPVNGEKVFPESELLRIEIEELYRFRLMHSILEDTAPEKSSGNNPLLEYRRIYNHGIIEEEKT